MTEPHDPQDPSSAADELVDARLRAADPAASVPPAAPESVARLLEATMAHDPSTQSQRDLPRAGAPAESRQSGTRSRGPRTWLVAAAAAVVIAGTALFVLSNRDDEASRIPEAGGGGAAPAPTVTELTAGAGAGLGRCAVPSPTLLAGKPIAFDGTVDTIEGDSVTLTPTRWYAGGPTDLVSVEAPPELLRDLLLAVDFEEGRRYLVAADDDGSVMVCGFSAPWTGRLARVYAEAFDG